MVSQSGHPLLVLMAKLSEAIPPLLLSHYIGPRFQMAVLPRIAAMRTSSQIQETLNFRLTLESTQRFRLTS